jgi:hypothetical protein
LHFNDNKRAIAFGQAGYDKLHKVRPIIDSLNQLWPTVWTPGWSVSVDELMVGFKGRTYLRQYLPKKIIKWGFKLWGLCCGVSGFCIGFDPYTGQQPGEKPVTGLGQRVVEKFAEKVQPGSVIFADNFFSSVPLAKSLKEQGKHYVGTFRPNRKHFPKEIVIKPKADTARGAAKFAVCNKTDLRAVCWYDNKPVCMISTIFSPHSTSTCMRRGKNAQGYPEKVRVPQPALIHFYNKYMGGVDQLDQLRATFAIERMIRTNIWYKKLYFGIFGISLVNAYLIYRHHNPTKTHEDFQIELQKDLLGDVPAGDNVPEQAEVSVHIRTYVSHTYSLMHIYTHAHTSHLVGAQAHVRSVSRNLPSSVQVVHNYVWCRLTTNFPFMVLLPRLRAPCTAVSKWVLLCTVSRSRR